MINTPTNGHANPAANGHTAHDQHSGGAGPAPPASTIFVPFWTPTPRAKFERLHHFGNSVPQYQTPAFTIPSKLLENQTSAGLHFGAHVVHECNRLRSDLAGRWENRVRVVFGRLQPEIDRADKRIVALQDTVDAEFLQEFLGTAAAKVAKPTTQSTGQRPDSNKPKDREPGKAVETQGPEDSESGNTESGDDALASIAILYRTDGDLDELVGSDEVLAVKLGVCAPRPVPWTRKLALVVVNLMAVLGVGPLLGLSMAMVLGCIIPANLSEEDYRGIVVVMALLGCMIVGVCLGLAGWAGSTLAHVVVEQELTSRTKHGLTMYRAIHVLLVLSTLLMVASEVALGYNGLSFSAEVQVAEQRMLGNDEASVPASKKVAFIFFAALGLTPAFLCKLLAAIEELRERRRRALFAEKRHSLTQEKLKGVVGSFLVAMTRRAKAVQELKETKAELAALHTKQDAVTFEWPESLARKSEALEAIAAHEFADVRTQFSLLTLQPNTTQRPNSSHAVPAGSPA